MFATMTTCDCNDTKGCIIKQGKDDRSWGVVDNMAWLGNLKISSKLLGSFYVIMALMVSVGILSLLKLGGFQS